MLAWRARAGTFSGSSNRALAHWSRSASARPCSSAAGAATNWAWPPARLGVVLLPALAFHGGLGDLLATTAMGDWPEADGIDIAFGLDSWQPTRGTRGTGRRNAGRHVVYSGDRFLPPAERPATISWEFPGPLGAREVAEFSSADQVTVSRHLRTPDIRVHMNRAPLRDLRDPDTPAPEAADGTGRSAQTFLVDVVVHRGGEQRRASASGRDTYAVTGPLVAEATARVPDGRVRVSGTDRGVYAAGDLFDAEGFLRALSPEHLSLESHSDAVIGT